MKLTSKQFKKADKLWRQAAMKLFNSTCFACGRNGTDYSPIEVHHIIGRRNWHARLKLENSCCLCRTCHAFRHNDPNGKQWLDQLIEDRFPQWWVLIENLRHIKPHPYTQECLELDVERLKAATNGDS